MWKIHENRLRRGLGGTYQSSGLYEDDLHHQDMTQQVNNGVAVRAEEILSGTMFTNFINNQFHRWNSKIDKNNAFHDDFDKHAMYENDTFERMKPYQAKKAEVMGNTTVVPVDDNDALYHHYDMQGETAWTNPPDPNKPFIDHGLDEENVWAFRKSVYNQNVVMNYYNMDMWEATKLRHQPFWGQKLAAPAFYTDERYSKFFKQWQQRLGLELIKLRQADEFKDGDAQQYEAFKAEIQEYLNKVETDNIEAGWSDVYVTDHKQKAEKLLTHSDEEAEAFYKYKQSLEAYKAEAPKPVVAPPRRRYEKGSLAQRLFDPLQDAVKDDEGCLNYTVQDKELTSELNEARLRRMYEAYSNQEPIDGALDEDDDDLRVALMEELDISNLPIDEWNDMLDRELSVFKGDEKYDYVKDIQDAFQVGLRTPLAAKILKTIPAHAFMDIKKPVGAE